MWNSAVIISYWRHIHFLDIIEQPSLAFLGIWNKLPLEEVVHVRDRWNVDDNIQELEAKFSLVFTALFLRKQAYYVSMTSFMTEISLNVAVSKLTRL